MRWCLCLLLSLGQQPATSPQAPSADGIARLVEELDAETLSARQAAARKLNALGPAALPLLPDPAAIKSVAAREELTLVRQRLERQLAEQSLQASTITLAGRHPPSVVLEALARQTGNEISARPEFGPEASVQCDWSDTPFWTAITTFSRQTQRQIGWNRDNRPWKLLLERDGHPDIASASSGPFRMVIRHVQVKKAGDRRLLRVGCVLQAEPRIEPLFAQWPLEAWSVVSDGKTSAPWNPAAVYELPFADGSREVSLEMDFLWSGDEPPRQWSLAGSCTVHLSAGQEPFVFAGSDLRRGARRQRPGVTAQIRQVHFHTNEPEANAAVEIVVNYERGGPAFESHRSGLFHRSAWLESDAGDKIPYTTLDVTAEADGGLAVEYHFANLRNAAERYRFVYQAPILLLEAAVDVRMDISPK